MLYMGDSNIVLSILVISHNQAELLSRCLDSILSQQLDVRYEVVISDDRSTDGTWELIKEYEKKNPDIVRGVKCNSDECNPITRSERCGWNKANAYKHSRGDFFVNIDADDYLKSADVYQKQLDALIANPDCSMCQQRVWQVDDGAPLESGSAWPQSHLLKDGIKMDPEYVILNGLQGLNQTYMIRRNRNEDPTQIFGKWYDDTIITLYHLQFGNVIFLDRSDYVWVQYQGSISNSDSSDDRLVLYSLLPYLHMLLIPNFKFFFLSQPNLHLVHLLKKSIFQRIRLETSTKDYWSQFDGFIFQYYSNKQRCLLDRVRLVRILLLYRKLKKRNIKDQGERDKMFKLLLG